MRNRSHSVMVRMDDAEYAQFCVNVIKSGQTKQAYVTNAVPVSYTHLTLPTTERV